MKTLLQSMILVFCIIVIYPFALKSQNPTGFMTIIQQPCNFDGIVATTITSGMIPPLSFYYYGSGNNYYNHPNINAMSDTLNGCCWIGIVSVWDNFNNHMWVYPPTPPPFTVDWITTTPAICPNPGTALVTINGGAFPDSVKWYSDQQALTFLGSSNPISLPSGSYYALVFKDGCSRFSSDTGAWIQNISNISYNIAKTVANCTNGTATITNITGGIPPYSYLWSNGQTSSSISNLSAGYFIVIVTDSQGCYEPKVDVISQAVYIGVNPVVTDASCLNNDGSVISFATGGSPPYTYTYSNGVTGPSVCCLPGNSYLYLQVSDNNNCVGNSQNIYIGISTPISVTYTSTISSCTVATGSAQLTITGGTAPYSVQWNTFPIQTGISVTNLPPGEYQFNVTDAVGCERSGTVVISPQSTINATINVSPAICPNNTGQINLMINGTDGPFTCQWSNGAITQNLQNVPPGYYNCTITDNVGCSISKYANINQVSSLNLGVTSTPASCLFTSDGSVMVNSWGGTPPIQYQWNNGQTGTTANGLPSGYYYVMAQDANGCTSSASTYVGYNSNNNSCYCTIQGTVYVDSNGNCIKDPGETGINHIQVHCSGFGYTFTNANGEYSFKVPTGNYYLSESVQAIYPLASCQNNYIAVNATASSGCIFTINFANVINPLHDIQLITTNLNCSVPGNIFNQGIIVSNDGTLDESNIQLSYVHDGQLQFNNSSVTLFTQPNPANNPNWYCITNNFPTLSPGNSMIITNQFLVPTNIPLATIVNFKDTSVWNAPMSNWVNDNTPWNNLNQTHTTIVGSYDPNFVEVSPAGLGQQGYITPKDSILNYIVHFQNTGTHYASRVVVSDTLDPHLNLSSLKPGYSKHPYEAFLSEDGVLSLTFNNIHLLPERENYEASMGFVCFSIKLNSNLPHSTLITNSADIYFDYNAPVKTNTTQNTISYNLEISNPEPEKSLPLFPNPAVSILNLDVRELKDPKSIQILDLTGRKLMSTTINTSTIQTIDINNLSDGIYVVQVICGKNEIIHNKFIKIKP